MATTITLKLDDAQEFSAKKLKEYLNESVYTKALIRAMDIVLNTMPTMTQEISDRTDESFGYEQALKNLEESVQGVKNAETELKEQMAFTRKKLAKR